MRRFEGMVVIVNGADTGLGAGTASDFLQKGTLAALSGRREKKLYETLEGIDPVQALIHTGDVSDKAYVARLVADTFARGGRLDVLGNNVGMGIFGPFEQTATEDWRTAVSANLDSVFCGARAAIPQLTNAKSVVANYTQALALELGGFGVRVDAVAPGFALTDATVDLSKNPAMLTALRDRMPAVRAAAPDKDAGVIAFKANANARLMNGAMCTDGLWPEHLSQPA